MIGLSGPEASQFRLVNFIDVECYERGKSMPAHLEPSPESQTLSLAYGSS